MTIYVILFLVAILAGMAISVSVFGTGGKRSRVFQDIYYSVEDVEGIGILYARTGEYSAILRLENPVQKYSADADAYYDFTAVFTALVTTLGEGYALHKQDVFTKRRFTGGPDTSHEYLTQCYMRYFEGREYTDAATYLTITQEQRKARLLSYDARRWRDFMVRIRKVQDQLKDAGIRSRFLSSKEASDYVDRYFAMDFIHDDISLTGLKVDEEMIHMGDRKCKVYSLVDVDSIGLPSVIKPYAGVEVGGSAMPVDLLGCLDAIPGAGTVVYNQVIFVPGQKRELSLLDKKKNRHSSLPTPANMLAVEDIKKVQDVIARESKQLVYCHFNIAVVTDRDTDIHKCTNYIENSLSRQGIMISRRAYNQLELFVSSFPGNCYSLSADYDRYLTLADAATCLMYKEHIQHSEDTPLKICYTDRQGVPVAIDISGKEGKEKIPYDDYRKLPREEQAKYNVYPKLQVYNVFNVAAQTNIKEARPELYEKLVSEARGEVQHQEGDMKSHPAIDMMIDENLFHCPIKQVKGNDAYYSISKDEIVVPLREQFVDGEAFASNTLHECAHATGAASRLDRLKPSSFGSQEYAREELTAELSAAVVASRFGLTKHVKNDSAAYLKSWLGSLQESPDYLKTVLADVKKATGMLCQRIEAIQMEMDKGEKADYGQFRASAVTGPKADAAPEQQETEEKAAKESSQGYHRSR